jgi:hypothetical protein
MHWADLQRLDPALTVIEFAEGTTTRFAIASVRSTGTTWQYEMTNGKVTKACNGPACPSGHW